MGVRPWWTMTDGMGSDGETGVVRAQFDWASVAPSTAVVETLAVATDREPTAMDPLYDVVDPDALDAFLRTDGTRTDAAATAVTFEMERREVVVRATGDVVVRAEE